MFLITDTRVISVSTQSPYSYNIGDNVKLLCSITLSHPIGPDMSSLIVFWNGVGMDRHESYIKNITTTTSSILEAVLTLNKVTLRNAGVYNCTASINESTSEPITESVDLCIEGNFL